jgi:hypothetical protein
MGAGQVSETSKAQQVKEEDVALDQIAWLEVRLPIINAGIKSA